MLSPARALSLLALLARADAATFYLPEKERSEHKPVEAALAALGIDRFSPSVPPGQESDAAHLWSLVSAHQSEIDLVWSADAAPPPFSKLSFSTTFSGKLNHIPGSNLRLTNADAFYKHIRENQRKKEKFFFNFVPQYFVLPRDQAEMPKVFAETAKKVEYELKREDDEFIYQRFLVRDLPVDGNEETLRHGSIITNNEELLARMNADHQGSSAEVTQYIEPYLIDGHKFQAGFYVAITSVDPLRIYYYGHPLIRIAKTPYPTRLKLSTDRSAYNFDEYIAPWDFPDLQKLYYEFPSATRPGTNAWNVVKRYMMLHGLDTTRLQQEIDAAIVTSIISSRGFFKTEISKIQRTTANGQEHVDRTDLDDSFFELLRFDFELDDNGKPWLTRIHSNPSMVPHTTVFGTDEAIKNNLLYDLFNLVGVHPQAKPSFEKAFVHDSKYCADKCTDMSRVWDSNCWSCPGGFAPYVARRLFDSKNEYARRGNFKLIYPSFDQQYDKFFDGPLSEHDTAFTRYIKSLSAAYAEKQDVPVFDRVLSCAYREHCSGNGDCVNGKCVCDDEYEGATCYVPKDVAREKRLKEEQARAKDSWMNNLWNRAPAAGAKADDVAGAGLADAKLAQPPSEPAAASGGSVVFGLLFVGVFAYGGYQFFVAHYGAGAAAKDH